MKFNYKIISIIIFLSSIVGNVYGINIGTKGNYESTAIENTKKMINQEPPTELKSIDITLDTSTDVKKLFSYRMKLSFDLDNLDIGTIQDLTKIEVSNYKIHNSFGFGIIRKENLRLWIGPHLSLVNTSSELIEFGRIDVGVGASMGLNLQFDDNTLITIDVGYVYTFFYSEYYNYTISSINLLEDPYSDGYINISLLHRLGK